jgi:Histidine kinase-, DNA gyrase B-, and HSP90-like ATPase
MPRMDPYRTMTVEEVPEAPRDQGIVGDVIAQFADPNAFYRELVQNAIDAGSPSVDIRIEHDPDEQKVHVTVRDRGEGMTQDTIENQLLVLFRSTKEADHSKIGKFGIGFASVLAPNPDAVIVQTARDGHRLTLHLFRDLTYELFDAGPATQTGTSVELVIAIEDAAVEPFVKASVAALLRWCRHATVPIELTYATPSAPVQTERIDRPLTIEGAIVQVTARSDDRQIYAAVGLAPDLAPYTGFFNHGLTLFETPEPLAGNVAAKLQDSRLGHTLSRDNVRRDEAFDRALAFARKLATEQLPNAVEAELRQAAEAGDRDRYRVLANAVIGSKLSIAWTFPLVDPFGGARSIAAADLGRRMWTSDGASPLTAMVTERGEPVIDLAVEEVAGLTAWIDAQYRCQLVHVDRELTLITPIEPSGVDVALVALLRDMLAAAGKAPSSLVLATLSGSRHRRLVLSGGNAEDRHAPYVLDRAAASRNPFRLLHRPPLVVSADHALVAAARTGDPRLAASHLARAILLEYQLLDVACSLRLLDHTLELLGVAG